VGLGAYPSRGSEGRGRGPTSNAEAVTLASLPRARAGAIGLPVTSNWSGGADGGAR